MQKESYRWKDQLLINKKIGMNCQSETVNLSRLRKTKNNFLVENYVYGF